MFWSLNDGILSKSYLRGYIDNFDIVVKIEVKIFHTSSDVFSIYLADFFRTEIQMH